MSPLFFLQPPLGCFQICTALFLFSYRGGVYRMHRALMRIITSPRFTLLFPQTNSKSFKNEMFPSLLTAML